MGKYSERIDSEIQDAIYRYIDNSVKNAEGEENLKLWEKRQQNLSEYKLKHMSKSNRVTRKTKEVTYDMLPELMTIAGLDLKDVYKLVGVEVKWPSTDAREMSELCDRLSDKQRKLVKALAIDTSPSFWRESEALKSQPTRRAFTLLERMFYRPERRREDNGIVTPALIRAWSDQKLGTSLNTIDFPQIAENFQVSLHWLLRMDKNTRALAKHADTEIIMTAYLFMAREIQLPFKESIKELLSTSNDERSMEIE